MAELDKLAILLGERLPDNEKQPAARRRTTACLIRSDKHVYKRAHSTTVLLEAAGMKLEGGHSYHFMTGGDVDALSYLQLVLLHQPLDYCLFSTWCMAAEDIRALDDWLTAGKLNKLDAYVGEIFPSSYGVEWAMMKEMFERHQCGRIAVARNHSKIFAGCGKDFSFAIETSANINTNPRIENGCITIGSGAFEFYKAFFDGIESIV